VVYPFLGDPRSAYSVCVTLLCNYGSYGPKFRLCIGFSLITRMLLINWVANRLLAQMGVRARILHNFFELEIRRIGRRFDTGKI
jgi:hypothetical protein